MDKLIPVWEHIQGVFWFWFVWKFLDVSWLLNRMDERITNLKSKICTRLFGKAKMVVADKKVKDCTNDELAGEIRRRNELIQYISDVDLKAELERREAQKLPKSITITCPAETRWPGIDLGENG